VSDAVIAVIITGVFSVIVQMIISHNASKDLYAKLDKQSEISDQKLDAKLEKYQAVTDEKIGELTREVRKHNNFAERMPVLEEKITALEKRVS
jgi:hypothetical protein